MNRRSRTGWQTLLADLSLILFLVMLRVHDPAAVPAREEAAAPAAQQAPSAIFRPGPNRKLGPWLAATVSDDRQSATVIIRHQAGARTDALGDAALLLSQIEKAGLEAALVMEPAETPETLVLIGYGRPALPQ